MSNTNSNFLNNVEITEMPQWVTWEDIRECIIAAHTKNAQDGISMKTLSYSAEQLKERIERHAIDYRMYVAIYKGEVIATAGISIERKKRWCYEGVIAHEHYGSVKPQFQGYHLFRFLEQARIDYANRNDCIAIELVTAEKNKKRIKIAQKDGYKLVDFHVPSDTNLYYVYMAKWLKPCPHNKVKIHMHFLLKKAKLKIRYKPGKVRRF